MNDKTLRALSVAMFAAALAACGGGSSSSSGGGSSSSSGSSTITILYSFGGSDGANPEGTLIQGSDGNFYGTTDAGGSSANCTGGCGTIFEFSPSSGTETVLYSFGKSGDGTSPTGLILGSDGNFYGTTVYGGSSANCTSGCGPIFEFSPSSGTETVLYSFTGSNGANPQWGLVQGSDGNFYGTTVYGGSSANCTS
ncbi:MAG TPA: choice-of-anchor tandem repeat GloVer-containing protein, partial [Steroidobacteraceae bacterium]|nr:choice-of-anchor tandem repeat GloVer-containing protein [Steroidobacteraceae bacterium]